ncbi:hypothetical protein T492DRAFT_509434 [Pavlovales sp. CCMP2436]|nr:hypothetical protein T492DRAFT_509434 [Pavlovales sp. CCMP2436]
MEPVACLRLVPVDRGLPHAPILASQEVAAESLSAVLGALVVLEVCRPVAAPLIARLVAHHTKLARRARAACPVVVDLLLLLLLLLLLVALLLAGYLVLARGVDELGAAAKLVLSASLSSSHWIASGWPAFALCLRMLDDHALRNSHLGKSQPRVSPLCLERSWASRFAALSVPHSQPGSSQCRRNLRIGPAALAMETQGRSVREF